MGVDVKGIRHLLITAAAAAGLSGCGGDDGGAVAEGGGQPNQAELQGFFIDAPVSGLTAISRGDGEDVQTMTDDDGRFLYRPGDNMAFRIGQMPLPPVEGIRAGSIITPEDLIGALISDGGGLPTVLNIIQLLLSLDLDGNFSNGITIGEQARLNAPSSLPWQDDSFDEDPAVTNYLAMAGGSPTLVDEQTAREHFARNGGQREVAGSWQIDNLPDGFGQFLVFLQDLFIFVTQQVPGGGATVLPYSFDDDRLAFGNYQFNRINSGFDANGEMPLRARGDRMVLELGADGGPNANRFNVPVSRMQSTGIAGAWQVRSDVTELYIFAEDGSYTHMRVLDSQQAGTGNENGTYAFDGDVLQMNVDQDGNGPNFGASLADGEILAASLSGDMLSFNQAGETVVLDRVTGQ